LERAVTSLSRWARSDRDVALGWDEIPDELLDVVGGDADLYARMSTAIWLSTACSRLARRYDEIISEHAAPDPSSIRRWARGDR
jgi:hypothetical protein